MFLECRSLISTSKNKKKKKKKRHFLSRNFCVCVCAHTQVWLVNAGDAPRYSHINFAAQHVVIFAPRGVLGDTAWPTIQDGDVVIDPQSSRENAHDFSRSYEEKYRVESLLYMLD